ncbi:hypothetical protein BDQ17DRAFT_1542985 [Cyathus striatus]|nr:hypothetical protein BDQ17DRAFT_1542985 [Cyathus striatus]
MTSATPSSLLPPPSSLLFPRLASDKRSTGAVPYHCNVPRLNMSPPPHSPTSMPPSSRRNVTTTPCHPWSPTLSTHVEPTLSTFRRRPLQRDKPPSTTFLSCVMTTIMPLTRFPFSILHPRVTTTMPPARTTLTPWHPSSPTVSGPASPLRHEERCSRRVQLCQLVPQHHLAPPPIMLHPPHRRHGNQALSLSYVLTTTPRHPAPSSLPYITMTTTARRPAHPPPSLHDDDTWLSRPNHATPSFLLLPCLTTTTKIPVSSQRRRRHVNHHCLLLHPPSPSPIAHTTSFPSPTISHLLQLALSHCSTTTSLLVHHISITTMLLARTVSTPHLPPHTPPSSSPMTSCARRPLFSPSSLHHDDTSDKSSINTTLHILPPPLPPPTVSQ